MTFGVTFYIPMAAGELAGDPEEGLPAGPEAVAGVKGKRRGKAAATGAGIGFVDAETNVAVAGFQALGCVHCVVPVILFSQ